MSAPKNDIDIFTVTEGQEQNVTRKSLTKRDLLIIFSISYGNFCLGTAYALIAPFFPHEVIG